MIVLSLLAALIAGAPASAVYIKTVPLERGFKVLRDNSCGESARGAPAPRSARTA